MNTTDTPSSKLLTTIEVAVEKIISRQFEMFGHTIQLRFDEINQRFENIDRRFSSMDQRFKSIDQRFDENEVKQNEILNAIGGRFDDHEKRILALEK